MLTKRLLAALATAAFGSLLAAGSASAVVLPAIVQPCATFDAPEVTGTGVTVDGCTGWYAGNLNGGSPTDIMDAQAAISALTGTTFTGTGGGNFDTGGPTVTFPQTLDGEVIVSFHNGGAVGATGGLGADATAFFDLDIAGPGVTTLTLNVPGWSNAEIWEDGGTPFVPEPATWALMLLGVGAIGATLRASRRTALAAA